MAGGWAGVGVDSDRPRTRSGSTSVKVWIFSMDFSKILALTRILPAQAARQIRGNFKNLDLKTQISHLPTDKNIPECERLKIGFGPDYICGITDNDQRTRRTQWTVR